MQQNIYCTDHIKTIVLIFLISILGGCASFVKNQSHPEKNNCSQLMKEKAFIHHTKNSSRSLQAVRQKTEALKPEILSFLGQHDSLFKSDGIIASVKIYIKPDGTVFCATETEDPSFPSIDTLTRRQLDSLFESMKFDNVKNYPLFTKANFIVNKKNGIYFLKYPDSLVYLTERTDKSIAEIVLNHYSELKNAYEQRLQQKGDLTGRITMKFEIDNSGKVLSAIPVGSATTLDDTLLIHTITNQLKTWTFCPIMSSHPDTTEIIYPFMFKNQ